MSRALSDIVRTYYNMDIENLDGPEIAETSKGLLSRKPAMKNNTDKSGPAYYIGQQMKVIRKHRDEIKTNGT
mgnify:FL=1